MESHLEIEIYSNKLTNFKWKTLKKVSTVSVLRVVWKDVMHLSFSRNF